MHFITSFLLVVMTSVLAVQVQGAGVLERFGLGKNQSAEGAGGSALGGLTQEQIASGLKEALAKGVQYAITNLGRTNGFLNDPVVRIPIPESIQKLEMAVRASGQGKLADDFVVAMNRAAEQAVPEAAGVLRDSIKQLTLKDAKGILTGTNNAATEYFRRTSSTNLYAKFLPIVRKATDQTGVTRTYKQMTETWNSAGFKNLGALGTVFGQKALDVDAYVTRKALDGLFHEIAEQERLIREDPLARTTGLLEKVFGTGRKKS